MKKLWQFAVAAFLAVVLIGTGVHGVRSWRANRDAETRAQISMQVNDSTKAATARLKIQKDSLAALVDAGKTMNGEVVAGVKIVVKPETVFVAAQAVVTATDTSDQSRSASLTDTTKTGYIVTVNGQAPKYPAPLKLGYNLVTPEFHPEVGFVKRPEGYYATVSWAGQNFEVKNAFYTPPKERPLTAWVGADLYGGAAATVVGFRPRMDIYGVLSYAVSDRWSMSLKALNDGSPWLGIGLTHRVW